jgi:hypothetical protein
MAIREAQPGVSLGEARVRQIRIQPMDADDGAGRTVEPRLPVGADVDRRFGRHREQPGGTESQHLHADRRRRAAREARRGAVAQVRTRRREAAARFVARQVARAFVGEREESPDARLGDVRIDAERGERALAARVERSAARGLAARRAVHGNRESHGVRGDDRVGVGPDLLRGVRHRDADFAAERLHHFEALADALSLEREILEPARARIDVGVRAEQEDRGRAGQHRFDGARRGAGPVGRVVEVVVLSTADSRGRRAR